MENYQTKCALLPDKIADKVMKVTLEKDHKAGETARAILFVPKGSCVYPHSHSQEQNPDSEVYIDLLEVARKGLDRLSKFPEVAGSNSPTYKLIHSIEKSNQPQVFLAIKKGQQKDAWNDFKVDIVWYLKTLNLVPVLEGNKIIIKSNPIKEKKEIVEVDMVKNKVNYWGQLQENTGDIMFESSTLADLENYNQNIAAKERD